MPQATQVYHGTKAQFQGVPRPDRAGLVYVAHDARVCRDYGPRVVALRLVAREAHVVDVSDDAYDVAPLVQWLRSHGEHTVADVAAAACAPDADGVRPAVFAALRQPDVVAALERHGARAVRFRDDQGWGWQPTVMAVFPRFLRARAVA
jgi:hypothetical protein